MALINVRLSPEDDRKARALRSEGVRISSLVREALRKEYERRIEARASRERPSSVVQEILREFPHARSAEARTFDWHDRRAVREHIQARLRKLR
jgi:hypothetical protein